VQVAPAEEKHMSFTMLGHNLQCKFHTLESTTVVAEEPGALASGEAIVA
jgi:hypothetical protein